MNRFFYSLLFIFSLPITCLFFVTNAGAQVSVVTQHNNLQRTGWLQGETTLNQSNVNTNTFGKLFSLTVDDQIYAQPLVVSHIKVHKHDKTVVYVATVNNSVYAFLANAASATQPIWHVNLTPSGYRPITRTDMTGCGDYRDFTSNMGIVGTPVIDTAAGTMYVVARSISTTTKTYVQYLHAINIRTGEERPNSPVYITATYAGTGEGSVNGTLTFDQQKENQRPGLALYKGVVYISWASHCDWSPYHGWVMGYDATTLQQKYIYNDTPDGIKGGIWMSGQAPAIDDSGYVYVATGNGTVGVNTDPNNIRNRGESVVKLSTASGNLMAVDFFTPHQYQELENGDLDYGCDGVMLIPNTTFSLSGSKESLIYVVDSKNMGKTTTTDAGVHEVLNMNQRVKGGQHVHGTPVYFKNNAGNEYVYAWAEDELLQQIPFNRTTGWFDTASTNFGTTVLPEGMPGSMLSISSNGLKQNSGILWASHPLFGDANAGNVRGILQAFSADDVTHELWNSNQNPNRDSVGTFAKFVCPTIANGRVYLATFSNQLDIYGLLPGGNTSTNRAALIAVKTPVTTDISDFQVYPNPARDLVTLSYTSTAKLSQETFVTLLNSEGKPIYKKMMMMNPALNILKVQIPAGTANGLYLLQLANSKGILQSKKIEIQK